ncbi:unnamed protein product, partial [Ranitomeya imitator]
DSSQIGLLKELLDLQKDMVVMLLSLLEGNVVNGTIARQMVDMLVESSSNVEMILKFFDMFLKLKDIVASDAFRDYVTDPRGLISKKDFQKAMDSQKQYTTSEIQFLLSCSEADENEMINFEEFADRFQEPAKDIGFNVAVLLTNLSEHVPHDTRLQNFLELADCIINYFKPYLGKIEIMGAGKKIERIYFEISETNKAQWEMPQVKESKRQFIFDVVNEGGESEKMELFVNFCEDTIFEMQIASQISEPEEEKAEDDDDDGGGGSGEGEEAENGSDAPEATSAFGDFMNNVINFFKMFTYKNLRRQYRKILLKKVHGDGLPAVISDDLTESGDATDFVDSGKEEVQEEGGEMFGLDLKKDGGHYRSSAPDAPGGLGDMGDTTPVEPPTPEGSPILRRKFDSEEAPIHLDGAPEQQPVEEEPVPEPEPEPEEEKADSENGEKGEVVEEAAAPAPEEPEEPEVTTTPKKAPPKEKKGEASEGGFEFWNELEIQRIKFLNYLSRNFYNLRFLALFLAFAINFILLFYKASSVNISGVI